jgi:geranyl-CoA carboxylase alpha subunit
MARMTKTPFASVLVANRGEIALRIMKTARKLGLATVAVYTRADALCPYVAYGDQTVLIGDGPVGSSYLSIEKILAAARETNAEAIHPGYGFLSENADFARAVRAAGLVFIGPSAQAIDAMGNKAEAKRRMQAADVTCIAGYDGADQSESALTAAADELGFPLMIKAAMGGGGRGMRLVQARDDLAATLSLARTEARAAFGSDELILERAIMAARHVEVQIFADRTGHTIHLGERDCSLQRRHQKIIEEAPSPAVSDQLRARMGAAAVQAARAVGYEGAGTVEFLLDASGEFYFLEMNTRLQVEHPVTEMITGLDLVELQFRAARGDDLGLTQSDVEVHGHAIEARIYAEEPTRGFMPSSGAISWWQMGDETVRVDGGVGAGAVVSSFYDPMLAKVIAHGETREQARCMLLAALGKSAVFGPQSNRDFLIEILQSDEFQAATTTTDFITETFGVDGPEPRALSFETIATAAALTYRAMQNQAYAASDMRIDALLGWGSSGRLTSRIRLGLTDEVLDIGLTATRDGALSVRQGEARAEVRFSGEDLRVNGRLCAVSAFQMTEDWVHLATPSLQVSFRRIRSAQKLTPRDDAANLYAPMHGALVAVNVELGAHVNRGDRLVVLEAMKMQHELLAGANGIVRALQCKAGTQVRAGDLLVELDLDDGPDPQN